MTTAEMPITRSDLRDELQRELRPYATKEDLQRELRPYVTKEDLLHALQPYATKEDLANLKADLRGDLTRLILAMVALQAAGLGAVAAIVRFAV